MINGLFAAVRSGDANQVADLINKGDDVNARDNRGNTSLHLAAIADELQVVEKLIEKGADINAKNNNGDTPLHWAVKSSHLEVAEFLISKHADVNAKNKDGWTSLHFAAADGNLNIVKLILDGENGVDARGALAVANTLNEENSLEIRNLLEEMKKSPNILTYKKKEAPCQHVSIIAAVLHKKMKIRCKMIR